MLRRSVYNKPPVWRTPDLKKSPTTEEVRRLVSAAETPLEKAVAQTLYSTGIRISELVRLELNVLRRTKVGTNDVGEAIVRDPTGNERTVPFDPLAMQAIAEYEKRQPKQSRYLFESEENRKLTISDVLTLLNDMAVRTNLPYCVRPDTFRKACEWRLFSDGVPISLIEAMLGRQMRLNKQARFEHLKGVMKIMDGRRS
jgi:site-specific recombinase XerD